MSFKKSFWIGMGVILLSFLGVAIMMNNQPKPPKKPIKNSEPLVAVFLPNSESVTFEVKAHGVVKPRTETTLVSEVSGVIQKVSNNFVAGGFFKKGEVLLQIEPIDYEVGVEQARARLASVKAKYAQEQALAEQAKKEWDLTGRSRQKAPIIALREPFILEAKANVLSAQADLKKAKQKLTRTMIRAPYDGMVKMKQVDIGQFVAMGTQLGKTFAIDYAEVRLPLTAQELAFINIPDINIDNFEDKQNNNSKVILTTDYAGERHQWEGVLIRMEGVIDEQSRVHYAVVQVSDPYSVLHSKIKKPPLKVGAFVTASIEGKHEKNLIKLPREAFKDLSSVLVIDKNNKLYKRELDVVRSNGNAVYVRDGLKEGDRIIMTSIESPVQGMTLRIEAEEKLNVDKEIVAEKQHSL